MKLGSISDIWKHKPSKNQKWFLGIALTGAVAAIVYYKFFYNSSSATPATGAQSSFTGGYDCYNSYLSADGSGEQRCQKLNDALMLVRTALEENEKSGGKNLTPSQMTTFKSQEMQLLSQLQRMGCK